MHITSASKAAGTRKRCGRAPLEWSLKKLVLSVIAKFLGDGIWLD